MTENEFKEKFKYYLRKSDYRQKELALQLNVDATTLNKWLKDPRTFHKFELIRACELLGLDESETQELFALREPNTLPIISKKHEFLILETILIRKSKFLIGSDPNLDEDAQKEEQPQHRLPLPNYELAKTPITNAQYAKFVQAKGYESPPHWDGQEPPPGKENHPVVYVSWYDALEYCDWLSKTTKRSYELPSEAEWEKGARGTEGIIYPWGNDWTENRCNSGVGNSGGTTPVDAYPDGVSPYRLWDMSGNVWEWTRSIFKYYPYNPEDGREDIQPNHKVPRVLRGGSFHNNQSGVRCAKRHFRDPDQRSSFIGFRVKIRI